MTNKIYLLIPFKIKDTIKESESIFWDVERRLWYCTELTDGLKDYEMNLVDIEYMEKDFFKEKLKSMKWNSHFKSWMVDKNDSQIYYNS